MEMAMSLSRWHLTLAAAHPALTRLHPQEWKTYWLGQMQKQKAGDEDTDAWINWIDAKIQERQRKGKARIEQKAKDNLGVCLGGGFQYNDEAAS